jgi:hypothetical protein
MSPPAARARVRRPPRRWPERTPRLALPRRGRRSESGLLWARAGRAGGARTLGLPRGGPSRQRACRAGLPWRAVRRELGPVPHPRSQGAGSAAVAPAGAAAEGPIRGTLRGPIARPRHTAMAGGGLRGPAMGLPWREAVPQDMLNEPPACMRNSARTLALLGVPIGGPCKDPGDLSRPCQIYTARAPTRKLRR